MNFHIEYEREADSRWLAEAPEIPGVLTYGFTAVKHDKLNTLVRIYPN